MSYTFIFQHMGNPDIVTHDIISCIGAFTVSWVSVCHHLFSIIGKQKQNSTLYCWYEDAASIYLNNNDTSLSRTTMDFGSNYSRFFCCKYSVQTSHQSVGRHTRKWSTRTFSCRRKEHPPAIFQQYWYGGHITGCLRPHPSRNYQAGPCTVHVYTHTPKTTNLNMGGRDWLSWFSATSRFRQFHFSGTAVNIKYVNKNDMLMQGLALLPHTGEVLGSIPFRCLSSFACCPTHTRLFLG